MIILEQESHIAEIKNLFNRSPLQEIFLAHLEETTEVMRKSAMLSQRPSSPWHALRGSGCTCPPAAIQKRQLCSHYSLQRCSDQALFSIPQLLQACDKVPLQWHSSTYFSSPSVFPPESHRLGRESHGAESSRLPCLTNSPGHKSRDGVWWGTKTEAGRKSH